MANGVRRPGVVTFIGVIIIIQGVLQGVVGIVTLAFRERIHDYLVSHHEIAVQHVSVTWVAISALIIAVLYLIVGYGLIQGNRALRLVVAIVQTIHLGVALATVILHPHIGYVTNSLVTVAIAIFVLWALYGHKESQEFFEGV